MRLKVSILFPLLVSALIGDGQNAEFNLQNYHPASPTAFQFLKYTEMPVSEYTGVPNISIPIFQIEEDGVKIPLTLSYHSGGIRVNQEASWVGLGWDLTAGSIVQEINDMDDYGTNTVRLLPDWNESPVPSLYSQKISDYINGALNPGWNNIVPVVPAKPLYAYNIYSAYPVNMTMPGSSNYLDPTIGNYYYLPINGNRDNQTAATDLVQNPNFDSEPDVFSANFFGHSLKFIRNPQNNQIIVLNKQGYAVSRNGDVYCIITPDGDQFWFEQNTTVQSYSETQGGIGNVGYSSTNTLPSSRIWALTKVITRNKRQVQFNYFSSSSVNNYPAYSEKWDTAISSVTNVIASSGGVVGQIEGFPYLPVNGIGRTYSYSSETRFFLNSIIFPNGEIDFSLSDRNDILGGKKLDSIQIKSAGQTIKSYQFNYSYLDATSVGGNQYQPTNASSYGNTPNLRLQLLSMKDNSGAAHSFTYNPTFLAAKNSLAQDFWGFYNGQLTNTSLIPNPARLNVSQLGNISGLANNGNNNSANLTFAQAGILTSIKYPTGGLVTFEYELNQFGNYWVPDFSSTANQISTGNGLRIHAINYQAVNGINSKRTVYSYSVGKALVPIQMCRQYSVNSLQFGSTSSMTSYQVAEISAHGFFTTNSLGSGNCVGYDKVTKQEVDGNGNAIGRTESNFNNTPDNIGNTANSSSLLNASLPATKRTDLPENGTVDSILYYNNQNKLIKKLKNTFTTTLSSVYYGARFFGYSGIYYTSSNPNFHSVPRTLCGYYPIYDIESLPNQTYTTEYTDNNDSTVTQHTYGFDSFDQLNSEQFYQSDGGWIQNYYTHPYDDTTVPGSNNLWLANRISEVTKMRKFRYPQTYVPNVEIENYKKEYVAIGNKILISKVTSNDRPGVEEFPAVVTFDQYDSTTGKLLQYTNKGSANSMIWDYNGEYLVAEIKNASVSSTAYSSFEADGTGNWSIGSSTNVIPGGITGNNCYNLNSDVSKVGLSTSTAYIISYWTGNTTPFTIAGTISGYPLKGKTVNMNGTNWTYYEHKVTGQSSVTIMGAGKIDEVRLYPDGSQMNTYTYSPLIGLSSQCDITNRITYYIYDNAGRLKLVKDQDGNIIKTIDYHYQGQ